MRRRELLPALLGLALGCSRREPDDQPTPRAEPSAPPPPRPLPAQPPERVRIVSYNVLADEYEVERRIPALLRVIEQAKPDILALQEVAPWFLDWIAKTPWLAELELANIGGELARPNGQLIASRFPTTATRYRNLAGIQGRTVLITHVQLAADERLCIATTHMESLLGDGPIRAKQLDEIFDDLGREREQPEVGATIFCGDLNFGDGELPDSAHLDPEFTDLWATLRPDEPGHTWDMERSALARASAFQGEQSRRIDRILLRNRPGSRRWAPGRIEIIGDQPVAGDLFPSDHFGLVGEIVRVG